MAKEKTGYFVEDHADIMERLAAGTATAEDQRLAAAALHEADIYQDVYNNCTDKIEPYIERVTRPDGDLPASLCDSVDMLLEFWLANRQNPACNSEVMGLVRKGLTVGAKHSLAPCIEALAKVTAESTEMVPGMRGKNAPNGANLAPGFPTRLQKLRIAARVSAAQLAKRIRSTTTAIEQYEVGEVVPQGRIVSRIVKALQADEKYLIHGIEPEQRPIGVSSVKKVKAADEDSE